MALEKRQREVDERRKQMDELRKKQKEIFQQGRIQNDPEYERRQRFVVRNFQFPYFNCA